MAGETALSTTYNDLFATTRVMVGPLMTDQISNRIPYLLALNAMGRKQLRNYGARIEFNVFKETTLAEGYTDLDTIQTTRAQNFTRAIAEWKQFQSPITFSYRDLLRNNGEAQIVDMVKAATEAAIVSLANQVGGSTIGLFSNNTETTLTSLTGLQALVSATPTVGTVQNISRANNTWWRNQRDAITTNWNTDGIISLRSLFRTCSRGSDNPDLIVFNGSYMDNYERSLQATLSYNLPATTNEALLDLGFPNAINYKGATMFFDDGVPANRGYLVNTKYINWIVHPERDFAPGDFMQTVNQDGIFAHVFLMAEHCADALRMHGVLEDGDTFS